MKTKKKAISLIVLVITIIVLAILAATVVISIVNSGIINSSKDCVKSYDLAQVREIASLAWAEALVEFAGQSDITDAEYDAYVKQQLTNAGVNIGDYNIGATSSGVPVTQNEDQTETEYAGLTITADTEGFTFIPVDGVEVTDERLANLQAGDIVQYGDYKYVYGCEASGLNIIEWRVTNIDGWGACVLDESYNKEQLGELCGTIFEQPVLSLDFAFGLMKETAGGNLVSPKGMTNLIVAPKIPSSVIKMCYTFGGCSRLEEAPVIPSNVTTMASTFIGCSSLKKAPVIPETVTDMSETFAGCSSLEKAPVIPSNVTNMSRTFVECSSLSGEIQINSASVSDFWSCFYDANSDSENKGLIVKVPANSITYTTITTADLRLDDITIETFVPET